MQINHFVLYLKLSRLPNKECYHWNIPVWKAENTGVGIRYADHVAPSIRKS
jgi:hypothetical protein